MSAGGGLVTGRRPLISLGAFLTTTTTGPRARGGCDLRLMMNFPMDDTLGSRGPLPLVGLSARSRP
jgi:hypothetical protein